MEAPDLVNEDAPTVCQVLIQDAVDLEGDVALEASPDFSVGLAFGAAAFEVGLGRWVVALTLYRYDVGRAVEVSVAAPVEPMSGGPEEAGRGATLSIIANALSLCMRPGCDHTTSVVAAMMGPTPTNSRRSGRVEVTRL